MLPSVFKTVSGLLAHNSNQFLSGGLILGALGGLAIYLKAIPGQIYEKFLHLFTMTVVITDDSKAFQWFKWWFREQERSKKIRHVDITTPRGPNGVEIMFFPAPGSHWFWYKKRPFRMTFTRNEGEKAGIGRETRPESLTLRVWGRKQKFLRDFVLEVEEKFRAANKERPTIYLWNTYSWDSMSHNPRPLDSVILPADVKKSLIDDIQEFKDNKPWYDRTGMPYHRSYLLYGPPGTGKTSTLIGLANYFQMHICIVKLFHMNDQDLIKAIHAADANSMIVFEDVDCLKAKRKNVTKKKKKLNMKNPEGYEGEKSEKSSNLTLSGLLNALDGIETPSGALFFMTTNVIEDLDPALIRPGRVDKRIFLGPATVEQKQEIVRRFFPLWTQESTTRFVENSAAKTMAEMQEELKLEKGKEKE